MTRKDYEIIAAALAQSYLEARPGESGKAALDRVTEHVSHALQIDNSRFQPSRFMKYIEKLVNNN
jgi:hypothetical protein